MSVSEKSLEDVLAYLKSTSPQTVRQACRVVGRTSIRSVDGAAEAVSTPLSAGYAVVVVLNRRIASTARHVLQLLLSRPLLLVDLTKHLLKLTHLVTRSLAHGPWIAPTAEPIPPSNPPKASDDTPPTSVPVNAPSPAPTPSFVEQFLSLIRVACSCGCLGKLFGLFLQLEGFAGGF
ncbi:hypothetical protein KCU69_g51, partial [Aureobasidium melanogenum]